MKIPLLIETYGENTVEPSHRVHDEPFEYFDSDGEKVWVHYWVRWPSYDFIFATPDKGNSKYALEYGFFCFRKLREGKVQSGWQIYADQLELEELAHGFELLLEFSKKLRNAEWVEYTKNKHEPEVQHEPPTS